MEWLELNLTRWIAIRARGTKGIGAAVFLVLWLSALAFTYMLVQP